MSVPVCRFSPGTNGSGKSTFVEWLLLEEMAVPCINADVIAF